MHDEYRLQQIAQARQTLLHGGMELTEALTHAWHERAWIVHSWRRCLARGQQPGAAVAFAPVPAQARRRSQEANAALLAAARPEIERLAAAIAPIRYFVLLTDAAGSVIDTAGAIDHASEPAHAIARVGVDLSERSIGTSAIGAALAEQAPVWLHRGEHFFHGNGVYSCAGAPLFGPHGVCLGMLDVTGVEVAERPELRHLVAQSARGIENALVLAQPHALRLALSWPAGWSVAGGDAQGGLLCLDAEGSVTGANATARQMLPALAPLAHQAVHASDLFALPWSMLFDLALRGEASVVPLWSGLHVRCSAQRVEPAAHNAHPAPAAAPAARSLKALERDLIHQAMRDAGGRVADAAKSLGMSRATLYRRLRG